MSIISMHKKCTKCGREYAYDPSTGDFGKVCPKCGWPQDMTPPGHSQKRKIPKAPETLWPFVKKRK